MMTMRRCHLMTSPNQTETTPPRRSQSQMPAMILTRNLTMILTRNLTMILTRNLTLKLSTTGCFERSSRCQNLAAKWILPTANLTHGS